VFRAMFLEEQIGSFNWLQKETSPFLPRKLALLVAARLVNIFIMLGRLFGMVVCKMIY
jgi:hypothetical protein